MQYYSLWHQTLLSPPDTSTLSVISEVAQSCPTLCDPMDCNLLGSSVRGIFQARVPECVAISFSRGSSQPKDQTRVSHIVGRRFIIWAIRESHIHNWVSFSPPSALPHIWTHSDLGGSTSGVISFCLFILFMGFSRQEYRNGLPFPSPVNHILSESQLMEILTKKKLG